MSRDLHSFLVIVGYVWQILGRVVIFAPPPIRDQSWKGSSWIGLTWGRKRVCLKVFSISQLKIILNKWFSNSLEWIIATFLWNSEKHCPSKSLAFDKEWRLIQIKFDNASKISDIFLVSMPVLSICLKKFLNN